ncbi:hypothetical protein ACTMTF_42490 [Nonomuraea sp. ZG12]|uniref:hypothetical protein n=1 Tax=Nonomuraea sp. ZG12 TaxID=3452207 RepID=UPI003F8C3696
MQLVQGRRRRQMDVGADVQPCAVAMELLPLDEECAVEAKVAAAFTIRAAKV